MIQRIQSLYLLLATALTVVMFFVPMAWFAIDGIQLELYLCYLRLPDGQTLSVPVYTSIVATLACILPLVIVFLYKHRLLQIRLCVVEMVLLAGVEIMLAAYYFFGHGTVELQSVKPAMALPLAGMLFCYLALRAIFRDEMLVRSLDRIR